MRYDIRIGQPSQSFSIDAPYDSLGDALDAVKSGIFHHCKHCEGTAYHTECPTSKEEIQNRLAAVSAILAVITR